MNLVLFTHPAFLGLRSQEHFARSLAEAFRQRGHEVEVRRPQARVRRWFSAGPLSKWAGYVDQYLLFPRQMRAAMRRDSAGTLYVFCDQALGPWVPIAAHRPHVVHCHDLLALRSALGLIPEHRTSLTGRIYQRYIRQGFRQARHFISISQITRSDLHRHAGVKPVTSEVVYNGLNHPYQPLSPEVVRQRLLQAGLPAEEARCVLHVGGGQWYKNSVGVVLLYASYVRDALKVGDTPRPLWMVSPPPHDALREALAQMPAEGSVRFFSGVDADTLEALYSHAEVLLFPSLAEGFGWPIAEALACGCPVITTDAAPMTEVGDDAAFYLPRLEPTDNVSLWADAGARVLLQVLNRSSAERERWAAKGLDCARRFSADAAVDAYLSVYQRVLTMEASGGFEVSRQ